MLLYKHYFKNFDHNKALQKAEIHFKGVVVGCVCVLFVGCGLVLALALIWLLCFCLWCI